MTGTGSVAVAPDMATVSVGVEMKAPTTGRAFRLNSARMCEVFALLQDFGINPTDIQTSRFSLYPQWNKKRLSAVLDGLMKSGVNQIEGIVFGIDAPLPHRDQARKITVSEVGRKAALYADGAGVKLGKVLSIDEWAVARNPLPEWRQQHCQVPCPLPRVSCN